MKKVNIYMFLAKETWLEKEEKKVLQAWADAHTKYWEGFFKAFLDRPKGIK